MGIFEEYELPNITIKWLSESAFEPSARAMATQLELNGYAYRTISSYLSCVAHFSHWCTVEFIKIGQIDTDTVEHFLLEHLPACLCAPRCRVSLVEVRAVLRQWEGSARKIGALKLPPEQFPNHIAEELLRFGNYLSEVRGLQPITIETRQGHLALFLIQHFDQHHTIEFDELTPHKIHSYVSVQTNSWKTSSIKVLCGTLRSYFRFKSVHGQSASALIASLPLIASWRQATLPKALENSEVTTLLDAYDQTTLGGQRDYAIARCYIDLGLRTAEILRLTLDDINWFEAVLYIRGKGRRVDAYPCRQKQAARLPVTCRIVKSGTITAFFLEDRSAGYELKIEGQQLLRFARFADDQDHRGALTLELARMWATWNTTNRLTSARRIEVLRGFAKYCKRFESDTEIPEANLFGKAHRRLVPHIYSEHEIGDLLEACCELHPHGGLRGQSCRAIFGLLGATGMRVSEVTALDDTDVDLDRNLLEVRASKFGKSRWVPLHSSTVFHLREYVAIRDSITGHQPSGRFFVGDYGRAMSTIAVQYAFSLLRQNLGWKSRGGHSNPRIHDLRHTFICRTVQRWYENGDDVDTKILSLSTYVGHAKVADTYWYLTATPELLALAAARFSTACEVTT